jgi:uncharacterized membrane protein YdjX (TVP38/TMEM64 family)
LAEDFQDADEHAFFLDHMEKGEQSNKAVNGVKTALIPSDLQAESITPT